MDLNPLFTAATSFRPAGAGGELKLFEQVGIKLVHGWLVDPDSPEAQALAKTQDYDSAVTLIADADHIAKGRLVVDDSVAVPEEPSSPTNWTDEERVKIERGRNMSFIQLQPLTAFSQPLLYGNFWNTRSPS